MVNCAWQLGTICDLNILNLVTFQDNIKYKGDIPLLALIDFETNSPADSYLDAEQKKCLQCFVFHSKLKFDKVIFERRTINYKT